MSSYQDRVNWSSSESVHEGVQLLVNLALAAAVDGQGLDLSRQPLVDLVVPVLDEAARGNDDGLLDQRFAVWTLSGLVRDILNKRSGPIHL